MPAESALFVGLKHLFPLPDISRLTPLQELAESVSLSAKGPKLLIIEDMTGAGKTEAAVTLAHRLIANGNAHGVYVALPTMATANAMFERLAKSYRKLFRPDASPSIVLVHGKRSLVEGFATLPRELAFDEGAEESDAEEDPSQISASAFCADWIARSNKQAFLAQVGAGTIDQALLSVLPARHQALRLWGLADKVLIIDEAHAYDAYIGREIETLLRFHAELGGSAIILSATLPRAKKSRVDKRFPAGARQRTGAIQIENLRLSACDDCFTGRSRRNPKCSARVRRKRGGLSYRIFEHPLSSYRKLKNNSQPTAIRTPKHRLGYREWLGLVYSERDDIKPAKAVIEGERRLLELEDDDAIGQSLISCGGYCTDGFDAVAFAEAEMPLHLVRDESLASALSRFASVLVNSARAVDSLLAASMRSALFGEKGQPDSDSTILDAPRERLWAETEDEFHRLLDDAVSVLAGEDDDLGKSLREDWRKTLEQTALRIFDDAAPIDALSEIDPERIVGARKLLALGLIKGYGKYGQSFFNELMLVSPEEVKKRSKTTRKSKEETTA